MRVGALTNKAAHCGPGAVRSARRARRGLTAISGAVGGNICRKRRAAADARRRVVRKLAPAAHFVERLVARFLHPVRNSAQENVGPAHQNARSNRLVYNTGARRPTTASGSRPPMLAHFAYGKP
ncbi:MAG: hypothetical protein C0483_19895 [Pirellula sp.]|nr:hypothetical protein [Pirellula sp.]